MIRIILPAALLCAATASMPATSAELIVNGGFETGNYAGWSPFVWAGSSGNLNVNPNGANAPLSGQAVNLNPGGQEWVSLTDQTGPGAYSLIQSFTIPLNAGQILVSFDHVATDWSGLGPIFGTGLDPFADPNQHTRVEILVGGADPFTTAAADIVASLYLGVDPGQPAVWTSYAFNLTGTLLPGTTYYFRAAEVDNQLFLNQGLDNVSIDVAAVPEPSTWGLMIAGFAGAGFVLRRAGKARAAIRFA